MSDTPETDAAERMAYGQEYMVPTEVARKLERERNGARELAQALHNDQVTLLLERDEAREELKHITEYGTEEINAAVDLRQKLASALIERDEAMEALSDWKNAASHVESDHPDERHCGCVPVLRKLLVDARKERDEARDCYEQAAKTVAEMHYAARGCVCGTKNSVVGDIEDLRRERDELREENKKFREALEWIAERYDDSKPTHAVAMDAYEMSCTAKAVLRKEVAK